MEPQTATVLRVRAALEAMAGQASPHDSVPSPAPTAFHPPGKPLGFSQLNELLLLFGFDRVSRSFFQFLVDGEIEYLPKSAFDSVDELEAASSRFRRVGILLYGNIKYAFKELSSDLDSLEEAYHRLQPIAESVFGQRHDPILPKSPISNDETYLLGYLSGAEIERRLAESGGDPDLQKLKDRRDQVIAQGERNQLAYLVSDQLDVYVATSMRKPHEFREVGAVISEVFGSSELQPLKLRWFDPTQAYCAPRIDKGLAEALMLKRAYCTLYLAQQSDTLGKDSELASTLAQGKPVIAYLPTVSEGFAEKLIAEVLESQPEITGEKAILDQLANADPRLAWMDEQVRAWVSDPAQMDYSEGLRRLETSLREVFDRRAATLRDHHPLGIQVNLQSGVANGVLVARTTSDCARLILQIVTNTLEFDVVERDHCFALVEKITGSTFRVVTKDSVLTNAFWNFYLEETY